ncbi:hypothetical protein KAJ89_01665 [Candidatus Parcubacteria bacterium]|nr:hypothetical protein [Candidatus Parcubacteria bacterium]
MIKNNLFKALLFVVVAAMIVGSILAVNYFVLAWVAPTANPPDGVSSMVNSQWADSGSDIYFTAGNVGIGTINPQHALQISNTASSDISLEATSPATGPVGSIFFEIESDIFAASIVANRQAVSNGNTDLIFATRGAAGANTERMRINGDGSVGIGDTSPDGGLKLDVEGPVGATQYCDENGNNCTAAASLGDGGDVFTRWGNSTCPANTTLLISGYGFGGHYSHTGNGAEMLCLEPNDPGAASAALGNLLYAASTGGASYMPPGITGSTILKCAVCLAPGPSFELFGSDTCPTGWTSSYTGYTMGAYYHSGHYTNSTHCVDNINFDAAQGGSGNPRWYATKVHSVDTIGSVGYTANTFVKCAMCYKN